MFTAYGNPVSRAALAARRKLTAEPLDPPAGRVSAGQETPAVAGPVEGASTSILRRRGGDPGRHQLVSERRFQTLSARPTWFLNLDTVGSPILAMCEGEGPVIMEDYFDRRFRDLVARVAERRARRCAMACARATRRMP